VLPKYFERKKSDKKKMSCEKKSRKLSKCPSGFVRNNKSKFGI
jgi:hypothetical protein